MRQKLGEIDLAKPLFVMFLESELGCRLYVADEKDLAQVSRSAAPDVEGRTVNWGDQPVICGSKLTAE